MLTFGWRRFDALMRTYDQLAEYVLASLRIDTRCRTIHFLDLAMRRVSLVVLVLSRASPRLQGNYRIDRAVGEPDPHIIDLNTDLSICDEFATATLPPKERRCVIWSHQFCLLITPQYPDSSLRDLVLSWSIYSSPTHDTFDSLMPWALRRSCEICWRCSKI